MQMLQNVQIREGTAGHDQGQGHLLHHALLMPEDRAGAHPIQAEVAAPREVHGDDVLELRREALELRLDVHDAQHLEHSQPTSDGHELGGIHQGVLAHHRQGFLALGIGQRTAHEQTHTLRKDEGGGEADDVILRLLGLLVPQRLDFILLPVIHEHDALTNRIGGSAHQIKERPRHRRHQEGADKCSRNLLLHSGEEIYRREARDVAQQDRKSLHPGFHHFQVVLLGVEPGHWQHTSDHREYNLERKEPRQHVHQGDYKPGLH
mmetsp:Transcript_24602/g.69113  ORF Transcript_24602/g.69113 Transcript_24602/m.69113 type:complete len:263 (-) Transcript_24602:231-1019(-)